MASNGMDGDMDSKLIASNVLRGLQICCVTMIIASLRFIFLLDGNIVTNVKLNASSMNCLQFTCCTCNPEVAYTLIIELVKPDINIIYLVKISLIFLEGQNYNIL